jgi:hypothetical protein
LDEQHRRDIGDAKDEEALDEADCVPPDRDRAALTQYARRPFSCCTWGSAAWNGFG